MTLLLLVRSLLSGLHTSSEFCLFIYENCSRVEQMAVLFCACVLSVYLLLKIGRYKLQYNLFVSFL